MGKGQQRGNRAIRKPKQKEAAPKPAGPFASHIRPAASTNTKRAKGKAR
jgi:hypothetical protein